MKLKFLIYGGRLVYGTSRAPYIRKLHMESISDKKSDHICSAVSQIKAESIFNKNLYSSEKKNPDHQVPVDHICLAVSQIKTESMFNKNLYSSK